MYNIENHFRSNIINELVIKNLLIEIKSLKVVSIFV